MNVYSKIKKIENGVVMVGNRIIGKIKEFVPSKNHIILPEDRKKVNVKYKFIAKEK